MADALANWIRPCARCGASAGRTRGMIAAAAMRGDSRGRGPAADRTVAPDGFVIARETVVERCRAVATARRTHRLARTRNAHRTARSQTSAPSGRPCCRKRICAASAASRLAKRALKPTWTFDPVAVAPGSSSVGVDGSESRMDASLRRPMHRSPAQGRSSATEKSCKSGRERHHAGGDRPHTDPDQESPVVSLMTPCSPARRLPTSVN